MNESTTLTYPARINWRKDIHPDIFPDFGKSATKKIKSLLSSPNVSTLTHTIAPLSADFFTWFSPLYDELVATRQNFTHRDIVASTLGNTESVYPYFCYTIFENDKPIGGAIFTLREDRLSLVYRAIRPAFTTFTTRCSPALYSEYLLTTHALAQGKTMLVHGSDPNLYGMQLGIGIATFKLSTGCRPHISKTPTIEQISLTDVATESLVLLDPASDAKLVSEAVLVTTNATCDRYKQLLSYTNLLNITTMIR